MPPADAQPAPPPLYAPAMISWPQRFAAALLGAACLALVMVAASLDPDARGHGTHEQLGLPSCGFLISTGRPCPTCGMTTAFSLAIHGHLLDSARTQPVGLMLALVSAITFWGAAHAAMFGSRIGVVASRLLSTRRLWLLAGLWAASWAYTLVTWPPP